jgi:response regulator RpfG family c-di-GMP phosphodiesterase
MSDQTILLLDDDEATLLALALVFRRDGYRVLTAERAEEALAHLERERVAVVVADQCLPDVSGIEFLRAVRQRWPDVIRIMLTALTDTQTAVAAINDGHVYRYLSKPWDNHELRAVVRDSVRYHELTRENRRLYELTASQAVDLRRLNEQLEHKVGQRTAEIAVKNRELEDNLLDVIRLLSSVQELRHSAMAGHAQRMADAARWLTKALGLPEAEQHDVEIAATLHNIGMLGLPDRVLHKDTFSLAREDQVMIRQSPLLGEALLVTIPRLRNAARIVRHQGEWHNGQGHPDGLSGEAIPIGSRILAVADAYERFGERSALMQGEGRRYDPRVVREFLRYLDEQRVAVQTGVELRINPTELLEGMILTRDLYTTRGLLLATSGKVVDQPTLDKIRNFHRVDPIPGKVYARA